MGADVMRWQYCAQPPTQNLLFGFGPGHEIQRKLLTLWNSASFFVQYANIAGFAPRYGDLATRPTVGELDHLDRWLVARTRQLVADATDAYEQYLTVNVLRAFEDYVDDVSNWYVRRSRRRFWNGDPAALRTLWSCLVKALRVVAPVMPFLTEHLWQHLVAEPAARRARARCSWPAGRRRSRVDEDAARRRGRRAPGRRARPPGAAASKLKTRQPLRRLVVEGADRAAAHAADIADELRVKEVTFGPIEATELRVRPNLKVLGPRLGAELGVRKAARGRRVRGARRRAVPGGGPRARPRRRARRAHREGGLGGGQRRRRVGRARHRARRRAAPRGPRLRRDPPRQHPAQGGGAGAHRPHPAHAPGRRRRPAGPRRLDRRRDARGGRGPRRGRRDPASNGPERPVAGCGPGGPG